MRASKWLAGRVWAAALLVFLVLATALVATTDVRAVMRTTYLLEGLTRGEHKIKLFASFGHRVERSRQPPQSGAPAGVTVDVYRPVGLAGRLPAVLLMPGFNRLGLEDPYIANLSSVLAGLGVVVAVPDLRELYEFRWSGNVPHQIAFAFDYLASRPDVRPDRIGMIGLSISGGFGLAAATQPSIADRLAYAITFAPFHNYERLVRFAATGCTGQSESSGACDRQVSPFARGIVLYNFLHFAVPSEPDLTLARQALWGKLQGREEEAQAAASRLSPSSRAILSKLETGDPTLSHALADRAIAQSSALAPTMSPDANMCRLHARLYLIHGDDDNVVPPDESERMYAQCQSCERMTCRMLKTPLYSHGHTFMRSWRKLPHYAAFYGFVREMSDDMLGIAPR